MSHETVKRQPGQSNFEFSNFFTFNWILIHLKFYTNTWYFNKDILDKLKKGQHNEVHMSFAPHCTQLENFIIRMHNVRECARCIHNQITLFYFEECCQFGFVKMWKNKIGSRQQIDRLLCVQLKWLLSRKKM